MLIGFILGVMITLLVCGSLFLAVFLRSIRVATCDAVIPGLRLEREVYTHKDGSFEEVYIAQMDILGIMLFLEKYPRYSLHAVRSQDEAEKAIGARYILV